MKNKKHILPKIRPSFLIVAEGQIENWYFQMFNRYEGNKLNIKIKPELPTKKSLPDQFYLVRNFVKDYDHVIWIINLDAVLKGKKENKKTVEAFIEELTEYIHTISAKYKDKVIVIINNPCFEFWLLLHFEHTSKQFSNCENVEKVLETYLHDYKKNQEYYTKQHSDIYLRLKPHLDDALTHAKKLKIFDAQNPNKAIASMHLFFEIEAIAAIFDEAPKNK
jgi:phenylpyruvate tautomerase PptA (4-oxalocrotonate tautomerase family)